GGPRPGRGRGAALARGRLRPARALRGALPREPGACPARSGGGAGSLPHAAGGTHQRRQACARDPRRCRSHAGTGPALARDRRRRPRHRRRRPPQVRLLRPARHGETGRATRRVGGDRQPRGAGGRSRHRHGGAALPAARTPGVIKVILVDDHALIRRGLRELLAAEDGIAIVGEASDYGSLRALVRETHPDVVLLDINLPGRSGLDALATLNEMTPAPGVVMLSQFAVDQYGLRALRAGAMGYLNKACEPEQIVEAVRQVAAGRKYVTPDLAHLLLDAITGNR